MKYQEIADTARAYADRNDIEVVNNINNFIALAEARMNRILKTRQQAIRGYTFAVQDQEFYSLPPDYAGMRDIQISEGLPIAKGKSASLILITPQQFNTQRNMPSDGNIYYTIEANQLQIHPPQQVGNIIELVYYQRIPNLDSVGDENWVSRDHPDIYIAGVCGEISLFAKDYPAADGWFERMGKSMDELDFSDEQERWAGGPMMMRLG